MPDVPAHAAPAPDVVAALDSDAAAGLDDAEAAARLARHGANRPAPPARPRYVALAARQLADPLVLLLIAAAAVSAAIGERLEGGVIAAIVLLNACFGFMQEASAERAILALRDAFTRAAVVVRSGRELQISAQEVVPGDLIVLHEGGAVPADARIVSASGLEIDASALTGESLPEPRSSEPVGLDAPLADRSSMVYAGTSVTRGSGTAVVTAVGDGTELGAVARLTASTRPPATPLQQRLGRLSRAMVAAGAGVTVVLAGAMLARGASADEAFLVGVAVAVAAVPEGLAATVTVALAFGARAMARRGAIVRRLAAIETLGETTTICTDKTGTLTENRLRVEALLPAAGATESSLLEAALLASAARVLERAGEPRAGTDPVEAAILLAALERGLTAAEILAGRTRRHEVPFAPERRCTTVVHDGPAGSRVYVKGAPEVVLAEDGELAATAADWAGRGLRVLAVAAGDGPLADGAGGPPLAPLGLIAMGDPLRPSAPASVLEARRAGIAVRMLTGDHPRTAQAIGRALGLPGEAICARVTPAEKLRLVEDLQRRGEVVAVTGDGVNDAPALRRADVGVAMGRSGTEAAREAASVVLTDDDFSTIVAAVREGRRIGDNIRKVVAFLLSANLGEVVLFAAAIAAGLGPPMTVVQILVVNVLTDGLPALALARDPASPRTMLRGPSRAGSFFGRPLAAALVAVGAAVGLAGLGGFLIGRTDGAATGQTTAFAVIALAEVWLAFALRSTVAPAWRGAPNPRLAAAAAVSVATVCLAIALPVLHDPLGTVPLDATQALAAVGLSVVPFALAETAKALYRRRA